MFWIAWFILAFVAGIFGWEKKIGFWGAFLLSLLLSPLIGFIIAILPKNVSKEEKQTQKAILDTQIAQKEALDGVFRNAVRDSDWRTIPHRYGVASSA
jgi:membrane protein implicated in regulation of membrane protease activity